MKYICIYLMCHSTPKPHGKALTIHILWKKKPTKQNRKPHPKSRPRDCTDILTLGRRHTVLLNTGTRNICLLQHLWHLGSNLDRITLWYNYRWLSRNSKRRSLLRLLEKKNTFSQKFTTPYISKVFLCILILLLSSCWQDGTEKLNQY